ncbi:MAG: hypothetical protein AAF696_26585 [Bacteroidota bacterium]
MKTEFYIKENGFEEIKQKLIFRTIPIVLIALCGGIAISHFNSSDQNSDINLLPFFIPLIIGVMVFGFLKGMRRQKEIFNSYQLVIEEERILRRQAHTDDIEIKWSEIKEISKNKDGSLMIKGANVNKSIGVPGQIQNMPELELRLSDILEIIPASEKSFIQKFPWIFPVLTVGLMMIVAMSTNKILVGLAGTFLTAGLIYSLVVTQRSKHLDKKTKRGMWLILIVLVSIVGATISKVFGY